MNGRRRFDGGDGRAYGLELMATKDFSHGLSANVSYALSKSERKFERIDGGRWFPFLFDRRHQLTLVGMWQGETGGSATFNLASGTPFTMPAALIKAGTAVDTPYLVYTDINNRRTPAYHRLDIGAARDYTGKRGERMRWALNIYNAYAHKNPSAVRVARGREGGQRMGLDVLQRDDLRVRGRLRACARGTGGIPHGGAVPGWAGRSSTSFSTTTTG